MDEGQDPSARLRALGEEAVCAPPDAEERLLDRILGQRLVPEDPQREAERDPAEAVVELGERVVVGGGDEREQRLVGGGRDRASPEGAVP